MNHQQTSAKLPATSFLDFIERQYLAQPLRIQRLYPSLDAFRSQYVRSYGFNHWWESMRGTQLTIPMLHHVGETLSVHGGKGATEIPSLLITLCRQYDISLPDASGILEPAYWQRHLSRLP